MWQSAPNTFLGKAIDNIKKYKGQSTNIHQRGLMVKLSTLGLKAESQIYRLPAWYLVQVITSLSLSFSIHKKSITSSSIRLLQIVYEHGIAKVGEIKM